MRRKKRTAAGSLTLAQTRAIGELTINFNYMEHSLESMIHIIAGTQEDIGRFVLMEPLLKPTNFRQKVSILRNLVQLLSDQYVPSVEMNREYEKFSRRMNELLKKAEKLNEFRNSVIHWRPFLSADAQVRRPKLETASATEIRDKALAMDEVGDEIFGRAVYLYKGDLTLTFGSHMKPKLPKK